MGEPEKDVLGQARRTQLRGLAHDYWDEDSIYELLIEVNTLRTNLADMITQRTAWFDLYQKEATQVALMRPIVEAMAKGLVHSFDCEDGYECPYCQVMQKVRWGSVPDMERWARKYFPHHEACPVMKARVLLAKESES